MLDATNASVKLLSEEEIIAKWTGVVSVSYTHLTLPTKRIV